MNPNSPQIITASDARTAHWPRSMALICRHMSLLVLLLAWHAGCGREPAVNTAPRAEAPAAPTNRIDVPAAVRQNLGITFAKVESRRVAATRRYPGRFELQPLARQEHNATLPGRVELLVNQYDTVSPGQPLCRIDSPQWREMQEKLVLDTTAMRLAVSRLAAVAQRAKAVAQHEASVEQIIAVWKAREKEVTKLIEAGGGGAAELATARAQLAEALTEEAKVHEELAELEELRIQLESDLTRYRQTMPLLFAHATGEALARQPGDPVFDVALARAASATGYSIEELMRPVGKGAAADGGRPLWRVLERIEVRATRAGVVRVLGVTNGAWAETGAPLVATIDPAAVRLRAVAAQADLSFLRHGTAGAVLPPHDRTGVGGDRLDVTVRLGLEANPDQRTIELIAAPTRGANDAAWPAWARDGVSAQLEIVIDATAEPALAIPASAVIQDGLSRVFFRRDPRNPDKVIRLEADLGVSDGQWIVVKSGVAEGDEVVIQGVYELKLASSQSGQLKGGHFHADGTWHADGAPEP